MMVHLVLLFVLVLVYIVVDQPQRFGMENGDKSRDKRLWGSGGLTSEVQTLDLMVVWGYWGFKMYNARQLGTSRVPIYLLFALILIPKLHSSMLQTHGQ